ncbi:MAG: peptidoglycan DD-metalloendopeptidase family protein [Burkholderiaceae bacterium]
MRPPVAAPLCALALCAMFFASFAFAADSGAKTRNPVAQARASAKKATSGQPAIASTGDPLKDQARQSAERDRLTARIAELRRQIAVGEKSRSGAATALARAEQALGDVNRRLDEIAQRQRAAQDLVATLNLQRTGTEQAISVGEVEFARTVTKLYANRDRDPLQTYLAGGDPDEALRNDVYLRTVAKAETADIDALHARQNDIDARRARADDDDRALAQQAEAQRVAREALASDRAAQRQALAQLSQKLVEQRSTANALEADEKRLSRVVEQLQRTIERRAADERARRETARKLAERQAAAAARKGNGGPGRNALANPGRAATPPVEEPAEALGSGAFAQLRGRLRMPVRGTVTGRYGAPRGGGGATWKGVFVKSDSGAEVHAVAAGKVIFADDLRGFGNLLIVDHGNQYLSIYGNNDILLKRTGDSVQPGDVISRAGNSSGDDQTGLYFELRFRGRPLDPLPWLGSR